MTTPLIKGIRRTTRLRGREYTVELSAAGISFREKGRRLWVRIPLELVHGAAERYTGLAQLRAQRERYGDR